MRSCWGIIVHSRSHDSGLFGDGKERMKWWGRDQRLHKLITSTDVNTCVCWKPKGCRSCRAEGPPYPRYIRSGCGWLAAPGRGNGAKRTLESDGVVGRYNLRAGEALQGCPRPPGGNRAWGSRRGRPGAGGYGLAECQCHLRQLVCLAPGAICTRCLGWRSSAAAKTKRSRFAPQDGNPNKKCETAQHSEPAPGCMRKEQGEGRRRVRWLRRFINGAGSRGKTGQAPSCFHRRRGSCRALLAPAPGPVCTLLSGPDPASTTLCPSWPWRREMPRKLPCPPAVGIFFCVCKMSIPGGADPAARDCECRLLTEATQRLQGVRCLQNSRGWASAAAPQRTLLQSGPGGRIISIVAQPPLCLLRRQGCGAACRLVRAPAQVAAAGAGDALPPDLVRTPPPPHHTANSPSVRQHHHTRWLLLAFRTPAGMGRAFRLAAGSAGDRSADTAVHSGCRQQRRQTLSRSLLRPRFAFAADPVTPLFAPRLSAPSLLFDRCWSRADRRGRHCRLLPVCARRLYRPGHRCALAAGRRSAAVGVLRLHRLWALPALDRALHADRGRALLRQHPFKHLRDRSADHILPGRGLGGGLGEALERCCLPAAVHVLLAHVIPVHASFTF